MLPFPIGCRRDDLYFAIIDDMRALHDKGYHSRPVITMRRK